MTYPCGPYLGLTSHRSAAPATNVTSPATNRRVPRSAWGPLRSGASTNAARPNTPSAMPATTDRVDVHVSVRTLRRLARVIGSQPLALRDDAAAMISTGINPMPVNASRCSAQAHSGAVTNRTRAHTSAGSPDIAQTGGKSLVRSCDAHTGTRLGRLDMLQAEQLIEAAVESR